MSKRLFVGNLSFDVSEEELQSNFAPWGASGATIPTSDSGRKKGFGFVDVAEEQAREAIAAMNGKELGGRAIEVGEAKPKPELNTWENRRAGFGRGPGGGSRFRGRPGGGRG
jgi:cold-inducible RNA-binding protein